MILNEVFIYAKENNFSKISLESSEKNIKFYEKFGFIDKKIICDDMHYMIKIFE